VSIIAISGLLMRIGMGILFAPMLSSAADAGFSNPSVGGLQTIIICTGNGLKEITIDADGNPVNGEEVPENCPLCIAMSGIDLALSAQSSFLKVPHGVDPDYTLSARDLPVSSLHRHVRNRSPPSTI